jgi:Fe-S-cluster containining protein
MLNAEANSAYKRPWHRLDRGLRLNRIRAFTESMSKARGLKESEQAALLSMLTKALDRKVLNSKTCVVYDKEKEEITEIKPLIMHQYALGEVLFQIMERRNAVTFRKRVTAEGDMTAQPTA